jgi:predicted DNA-binding ribbon-helix-helix protein
MGDQRRLSSAKNGYEVEKSTKRSIVLNGRHTSISIEDEFWEAFRDIAATKQVAISDLASEIAFAHGGRPNLSSGIRIFILSHFQRLGAHQRD